MLVEEPFTNSVTYTVDDIKIIDMLFDFMLLEEWLTA